MLSPLLQKLLFVRQFSIDNGKIDIFGSRYIMLNASALVELQNIDETKIYMAGRESSFAGMKNLVEHVKVYNKIKDLFLRNIAELGRKIGATDEGMIKTLQDIFNLYGLGSLEIIELDNKNKKAVIKIKDSSIAQEYVKKNGKSKNPVCTLTAGVLAGMFSYIMNQKIECIETKCLAQGASECVFKIG